MVNDIEHLNPSPPDQTRSDLGFRGLILTLVALFLCGIFVLVRSDYVRTVARADLQLSHFAELFEQTVDSSFKMANLQMGDLIETLAVAPLRDAETMNRRFDTRIMRSVAAIEQIDSLVVIDLDGTVIWATAAPLVGQNLSDRGYFQRARELGKGEYTVGVPIISRGTGRRVTPIAWPIIGRNGRLRGVIASGLQEQYFSQLLTLNEVEPDMHVEVVTSNGEVAFVSEDAAREPESRVFRATQDVSSLGLHIDVSRNRAAVMQEFWQRNIAFSILATLLFFTAIGAAIRSKEQSRKLAKGLAQSERDRKRIESAQKEFDAIFDNVGDGVVVFDDGDKFFRSNRKARELLDVGDDAAAVRNMRALLPDVFEREGDLTINRLPLNATAETEAMQAVQCRVMKLNIHGARIAYCVLEDISAQERLSAARNEFITSVNHELRTPLTSLAGSLELLQGRFAADLPSGAARLVDMATRNADRLLVLVNDILTLQAIDQQQLSVNLEPLSATEVLNEAISTNSGYRQGLNVKLVLESAPPDGSVFISADRVRLQQIFSNLISNAIKYSPPNGQVKIGVKAANNRVSFYVRDFGPGIPKSARDRLFERFAKAIHSRDVQASGTGLGLAITQELVKRQGGSINFETNSIEDGDQGHGTIFYVSFQQETRVEEPLRRAV